MTQLLRTLKVPQAEREPCAERCQLTSSNLEDAQERSEDEWTELDSRFASQSVDAVHTVQLQSTPTPLPEIT